MPLTFGEGRSAPQYGHVGAAGGEQLPVLAEPQRLDNAGMAGQVAKLPSGSRSSRAAALSAAVVALQCQHDAASEPGTPGRYRWLHWWAWRRRHQHRARKAHKRWNVYVETTP
jgi:hypothetical protein